MSVRPPHRLFGQSDGAAIRAGAWGRLGRTGWAVALAGVMFGSGGLWSAFADIQYVPEMRGYSVQALAAQADGRLLVAGDFVMVEGQPKRHLARLFPDGRLDPTFVPPTDGPVEALAVQADGACLIAGLLSVGGDSPRPRIMRLRPDGAVDAQFSPALAPSQVSKLLIQPDGMILAAGRIWTEGIGWQAHLMRLRADGTRDTGFSPMVAGTSFGGPDETELTGLALQRDGKILIAGWIGAVDGGPRAGLARLLEDGSLDAAFHPEILHPVTSLAVLPDGRILVAASSSGESWTRLLPDGARDPSFADTAIGMDSGEAITQIVPQADGRVLLAGPFVRLYGPEGQGERHTDGLVRVHADGTFDRTYELSAKFPDRPAVNDMLVQRNGGLWIGTTADPFLALVSHDVTSSPLEWVNPATVVWRRTGAQEEFSRVEFSAFDAATGGWQSLGEGTRSTAGWERTQAALPGSGAVRARGFLLSGSHGVAEAWLALGSAAPLLAVEDAAGTPMANGSGELVFPASPTWRRPAPLTVRLRNTGTGVMPVPSLSLSGPQAAAFKILNPPTSELGPQGALDLVLAFDPLTAGPHTARLDVAYQGQADGAFSLALQGQGDDTISPHFDSPGFIWDQDWEFSLAEAKFGTVSLGFVPSPGLVLTVLDQTNDRVPAAGEPVFDVPMAGLPPEGEVTAQYAGQTYHFRVNYEGGWDRKDLTLTLIGPGTPEAGFGLPQPESTLNDKLGLSLQGASVAADGTLLVQGRFQKNSVVSESRFFRPDGAPLPSVIPLVARPPEESHWSQALEDGEWLLGRAGPPIAPSGAAGFIRLTREGAVSPDYATDMAIHRFHSSFLQPDGRLLVSGDFLPDGATRRITLARLLPDGKRDASFQPEAFASYLGAAAVLHLPEGAVLSGPHLIKINGVNSPALVRWQPDGSRDPAFAVPVAGDVHCLVRQTDGRLLVGGAFSEIGGHPRAHLARLFADGTVDTDFAPGVDKAVMSLVLQADSKIVLAGEFSEAGGRAQRGLARLLPGGAADPSFLAHLDDPGFLGSGLGVTLQADGRLLVTGSFTRVNQFRRYSFARLLNDPSVDSLSVPDATTARWLRGGSAPESHDVWFEMTTDAGATWSRLGTGFRIDGGWEWRGATLPPSGHLRARARAASGHHNAFSSLIESVTLFGRAPTSLENWRQQRFHSPLNQHAGQDTADPDSDGLPNLLEYALGLDPQISDAEQAPQWIATGDGWQLRVPRPPSNAGVACIAEWSPTLQPDSWVPAEDTGTEAEHRFQVPMPSPAAAPTRFFRWRVHLAPAQ